MGVRFIILVEEPKFIVQGLKIDHFKVLKEKHILIFFRSDFGNNIKAISFNSIGTNLGPRVSIYDTSGNLLARLSEQSYGDEPGRFYSPHAIATDSKGDIYVAEVSHSEYGRFLEQPGELRSMQKLTKVT